MDWERGVTPATKECHDCEKGSPSSQWTTFPRWDHPLPRLLQDFLVVQRAHRQISKKDWPVSEFCSFHWLTIGWTPSLLHFPFSPNSPSETSGSSIFTQTLVLCCLENLRSDPLALLPRPLKPFYSALHHQPNPVISKFPTSSTSSLRIPFISCSTETWLTLEISHREAAFFFSCCTWSSQSILPVPVCPSCFSFFKTTSSWNICSHSTCSVILQSQHLIHYGFEHRSHPWWPQQPHRLTALTFTVYQNEPECLLEIPGLMSYPRRFGFSYSGIGIISQWEVDLPPQSTPICPTEGGNSAPLFLPSGVQRTGSWFSSHCLMEAGRALMPAKRCQRLSEELPFVLHSAKWCSGSLTRTVSAEPSRQLHLHPHLAAKRQNKA